MFFQQKRSFDKKTITERLKKNVLETFQKRFIILYETYLKRFRNGFKNVSETCFFNRNVLLTKKPLQNVLNETFQKRY